MNKNMTALVSAFARAYHSKKSDVKIYDDTLAEKILTNREYESIKKNMTDGINFFYPSFCGTEDEALDRIVYGSLAPSPLGRAAFANSSLKTAVNIGTEQYIVCGAGYDTFSYRRPEWALNLKIFEVDKKEMIKDKLLRLKEADIDMPENTEYIALDFSEENIGAALLKNKNFDKSQKSFFSLLGLTYYISQKDFKKALNDFSQIAPVGSSVIFDYPERSGSEDFKKHSALAAAANEKMLSEYSYSEIEKILSKNGFLIYEHLTPDEITDRFFSSYNKANPDKNIKALDGVNYCLAVRQNI